MGDLLGQPIFYYLILTAGDTALGEVSVGDKLEEVCLGCLAGNYVVALISHLTNKDGQRNIAGDVAIFLLAVIFTVVPLVAGYYFGNEEMLTGEKKDSEEANGDAVGVKPSPAVNPQLTEWQVEAPP